MSPDPNFRDPNFRISWREAIPLALLAVAGGTDLFVAIALVPRFRQLYHDLVTWPLPWISSVVMQRTPVIVALAALWPVAGFIAARYAPRPRRGWLLWGLVLAAALQIGIAVTALYMPLIGEIQGMPAK